MPRICSILCFFEGIEWACFISKDCLLEGVVAYSHMWLRWIRHYSSLPTMIAIRLFTDLKRLLFLTSILFHVYIWTDFTADFYTGSWNKVYFICNILTTVFLFKFKEITFQVHCCQNVHGGQSELFLFLFRPFMFK